MAQWRDCKKSRIAPFNAIFFFIIIIIIIIIIIFSWRSEEIVKNLELHLSMQFFLLLSLL